MSHKNKRKLTRKQAKLVQGIIAGKTVAHAARDAGYSENHPENAGQSGHQAIKTARRSLRDAMDSAGYTVEQLIEKHLRSKLEAKETEFFHWRKTTGDKTEQVIDRVAVVNLMTKATGRDIAFRLRGDYAPKKTRLRSR